MSANLITGNLFSPITAAEDSDFQAGFCGNVTKIMPVGNEMALSIEDANTIAVADGVIITKEGRRIQIDTGDIDEFTIPTGTQGTTAYYVIGFHLYTDSNTAAELCETFVEAVESSSSTITENTFKEGYTEVYVPLGMVVQDGVNLDSVTALLDVADTIESIAASIGSTDISAIGDGTVKGAISTLNSNLDANVLGTTVDITSYIGSIYTFPSDGYVKVRADTDGTDTCAITASVLGAGTNNTPRASFSVESKAKSGGDRWASLYVKKGMRFSCGVTGTSSLANTYFVPIQ